MQKKWRILVIADAIAMTTGPLCSCELPPTNRDLNDFTETFPLINITFACFQTNSLQFNKCVNFVRYMNAVEESQEKLFFPTGKSNQTLSLQKVPRIKSLTHIS